MEFMYVWKELSEDGLLKEPKDCGPHYSRESVNVYGGFNSEEEACEAYRRFRSDHKFGVAPELVLVKIYKV